MRTAKKFPFATQLQILVFSSILSCQTEDSARSTPKSIEAVEASFEVSCKVDQESDPFGSAFFLNPSPSGLGHIRVTGRRMSPHHLNRYLYQEIEGSKPIDHLAQFQERRCSDGVPFGNPSETYEFSGTLSIEFRGINEEFRRFIREMKAQKQGQNTAFSVIVGNNQYFPTCLLTKADADDFVETDDQTVTLNMPRVFFPKLFEIGIGKMNIGLRFPLRNDESGRQVISSSPYTRGSMTTLCRDHMEVKSAPLYKTYFPVIKNQSN